MDHSERTEIREIFAASAQLAGREITVCGWLRTLRASKDIAFAALNDGSCFLNLQLVLGAKIPDFSVLRKLGAGAALRARGTLTLTPDAAQPFELHVMECVVEGACPSEYPLQKKRHSMEFLREIGHLRPRTNTIGAAMRVRSAAAFAVHQFFNARGFICAHTPIITCADAEGAGEMFRVTTLDMEKPPRTQAGGVDYEKDFFAKPTYLTVSGQLQGEAMAMAFGKIYTFGPTFRAEHSYTQRHAAEFWMIEPEIAFADLADDMALAEAMVKYVLHSVLERCSEELRFFNQYVDTGLLGRLQSVAGARFARLSYTQALELLRPFSDSFRYPVAWGCDLQTEHERFLTESIVGAPVFVTDYPKEIKAFYMRQNDDGKTVAAMDLLVPGVGEIIGGSQREERLELLEERIRAMGGDPAQYAWYLDLRRYGGCPHAGFGLGFERLLMYLTGLTNIRDVLPFPRTTGTAAY
ncbi:MAG: asparagine--tRNA ligase [Oscillospiraceae bacterium]|jgi:asparaginyl-tRNA synthetase|nr:asparagine--tRNA ligase [Oscillospiraceae bacterium]